MDTLVTKSIHEIWIQIEQALTENKAPYATTTGTYAIHLVDAPVTYQLSFADGTVTITNETNVKADCTLKMDSKTFRKFLQGNLISMTAFMTGKLKVDGNIGLALKLEKILQQYSF
ncbi:SCP2 sterol-binding domain-containing protein [Ornithinibacillus contaminans]|uniref:SCP2 sterol-binding domain-containing protein n=1 Tax=Ornithinibacillus contaminans TaxID=694055 RepID=UPI00064D8013|nr:SCP2 sterol-binding domain-containing protein [Ornithinibacillus contaminans]